MKAPCYPNQSEPNQDIGAQVEKNQQDIVSQDNNQSIERKKVRRQSDEPVALRQLDIAAAPGHPQAGNARAHERAPERVRQLVRQHVKP